MADRQLFGNNVKPACQYCELSSPKEDERLECVKFGEVKADDACKKFEYSPLKRIPVKDF